MAGRELWAALAILDRQLVDRNGQMCGMVDDLELTRSEETGQLYVSAVLSGPGALVTRLGARRFGSWLRRVNAVVAGEDSDPVRVPFGRVSDIGAHITLSVDVDQTGTASAERWVRRHVIDHFPGSSHEAE
jgi:sporulation protein YlmC with PRC-barrel domain